MTATDHATQPANASLVPMTERSINVLRVVRDLHDQHGSVSLREVTSAAGYTSIGSTQDVLTRLRTRGFLDWKYGKSRTLHVTPAGRAYLASEPQPDERRYTVRAREITKIGDVATTQAIIRGARERATQGVVVGRSVTHRDHGQRELSPQEEEALKTLDYWCSTRSHGVSYRELAERLDCHRSTARIAVAGLIGFGYVRTEQRVISAIYVTDAGVARARELRAQR